MDQENTLKKLIKATQNLETANENFNKALINAREAGIEWDVIAHAVGTGRSRVIYLARRANGGVLPVPL